MHRAKAQRKHAASVSDRTIRTWPFQTSSFIIILLVLTGGVDQVTLCLHAAWPFQTSSFIIILLLLTGGVDQVTLCLHAASMDSWLPKLSS